MTRIFGMMELPASRRIAGGQEKEEKQEKEKEQRPQRRVRLLFHNLSANAAQISRNKVLHGNQIIWVQM